MTNYRKYEKASSFHYHFIRVNDIYYLFKNESSNEFQSDFLFGNI